YTCFFRSPAQLEAIAGPVIDFLLDANASSKKRLDILLFACSNGAEAYTIASTLMRAHPSLDLHIAASDLHEEMVARASAARYSKDEIRLSRHISDALINDTFDEDGDAYIVKP